MQLLINMYENSEITIEEIIGQVMLYFNHIYVLMIHYFVFQTFLFFTAGYETSTKAITFGLYELAKKQDLQDKVRQEIKEVLDKHNGNITFECLGDMKFLGQIIYGKFGISTIKLNKNV